MKAKVKRQVVFTFFRICQTFNIIVAVVLQFCIRKQARMNVKDIEVALKKLKESSDDFKSFVLYQQLSTQLETTTERSRVTSMSEEALLDVPGFSRYTINEIKNTISHKRAGSKLTAQKTKRLKPIPSLRKIGMGNWRVRGKVWFFPPEICFILRKIKTEKGQSVQIYTHCILISCCAR